MRNCLVYLFISSVIFTSCKKDESTPNPYTPGTTTTQGRDAEVYVLKQLVLDGMGAPMSDYHVVAFFGSSVTTNTVASVNAGTVTVNGTFLKMNNTGSTGPVYTDTTYALVSPYQLQVGGSGSFPAGSLQYGSNYPSFADTSSLPSLIVLNSGLSLQFNNCTNTDSVMIKLEDQSAHVVNKKYAVSNNQVNWSVTGTELNAFVSGNGSITVDMVKNSNATVGTKNYRVTLERRYFKLNVQLN